MTKFTNAYRTFLNSNDAKNKDKQKKLEEIALVKTLNFLEETLSSSTDLAPFVKLSVLKRYYCDVLENLDAELTIHVYL